MRRLTVTVTAAFLLTLTACGGSSEETPPPLAPIGERPPATASVLLGTYFYVSLSHAEAENDDSISETGIFVADGTGNLTITAHYRNDNGAVGGPITRDLRYDLAPDGSLGVRLGNARIWTGGVAGDGRFVVAASVNAGTQPLILIAMRQDDLRNDGFDASYHIGAYAARAYAASFALWGTHTFTQGRGLSVSNLFRNDVGAATNSGPEAEDGGTYSIGEGGDITLGMYPGYTLLGGRSQDGVIIAGGDILSPIDPMIYVGVPIASKASTAVFRGEYWSIATTTRSETPPESDRSVVSLSSVAVDGEGALFYEATLQNEEGEIDSTSARDVYTVAEDGTLTLGGGVLRGGITSSGSFAFAAGDLRPGVDPVLRVFIRK